MDSTPYYAPTFFSPYYFAPLTPTGVAGGPATSPAPPYSPTFFSPYYFAPLAATGVPGGVPPGPGGTSPVDAELSRSEMPLTAIVVELSIDTHGSSPTWSSAHLLDRADRRRLRAGRGRHPGPMDRIR